MSETSTKTIGVDYHSHDRSISELLDILWRRKWLIAGCVALSIVLGAIYLYYAEPVYAVRARVLVQPHRWPLGAEAEIRQDKEFLATQAEIIRSPAVIRRVLPQVTPHLDASEQMDPLLAVQERLAVEPIPGTNVVSLSYDSRVPSEGISTVEGILNSYQQFLQELNDDSRLESLHLLTRSEEKLRSELEEREAAYVELRKQSPLIGRDRDAMTFQWTLLQNLAQALSEARQLRIDLQNRAELLADASPVSLPAAPASDGITRVAARVADIDASSASQNRTVVVPVSTHSKVRSATAASENLLPLIPDALIGTGVATTPEFDLISRELLSAEMRESELAQYCGPKHPDLLAVKQQMASLKRRLAMITDQAPATLQRELVVAQTREDQLLDLYDQELQGAKANEDFLVKENLELDGIERLKSIHNSIVAQLNDWHLVEPSEDGGMGANVVVLQAPTTGTGPIWPKRSLLLSLCAATGMLLGLGIVVATKG
jgi:uncharacterized protein involved in exopolysaccharide biosynthesis